MSLPESARLFPAALCVACGFATLAWADDSSSLQDGATPQRFEAIHKQGEIAGFEQVRRVFVTLGTNEFAFVVPQGLRVDVSNKEKVVLASPDASFILTFRILGAVSSDSFNEWLLGRYPGAKSVDESPMYAMSHQGRAFELKWTPAGVPERLVRVAFVPCAAGLLEFSMVAESQNATEASFAYRCFVAGCISNEAGKLEIVPRLDRS